MIPKTFHLLFLLALFSKSSCYFILIQEAKTWSEAQAYCRENHVDLATVQTVEDRSKIQEVSAAVSFQNRAWMGLYDGVSAWRWSYQDQNLAYSSWASSVQTTSATQRMCAVIRNTGTWYIASCDLQKPFFCYQGNDIAGKFNFNSVSMSWRDAQQYCKSKYIDLAFVSDSSDNNALLVMLKVVYYQYEGWIGLSKNLWLWSDQSKITWIYVKWANGQPDNASGNEKCGFVHETGLIGDDDCLNTLPFFCTKRAKIQIVRFEVKSAGFLNESAVMEAIEKKMKQMLSGSSVTWRVQPDAQIFQERDAAQQLTNTAACAQ